LEQQKNHPQTKVSFYYKLFFMKFFARMSFGTDPYDPLAGNLRVHERLCDRKDI